MDYEKKIKQNWQAKTICGGDEFLKTVENIEYIAGAKWIWPLFSTRGFLRRDFYIESDIITATAHFICDNCFDIYLGGEPAAINTKEFCADVTEYLKKGKNSVALRVFQTDDICRFSSAVCGEIVVTTACGEQRIVTDSGFHNYHPQFSNNEPENWLETEALKEAFLVCEDVHPRQKKRSLYARRAFELNDGIKAAELCVFAAGEAEMYINGERVGDEYFSQGVIEKYHEYHTFDVTDMLRKGENVIGAITGNTWLNGESHNILYANKNALLAELTVKLADGNTFTLGTDGSWKITPSPVTDNDLQFGERYDARLEQDGWNDIGFDDSAWSFAEECEPDLSRPYIERNYPPVRVKKLLPVLSQSKSGDGVLFDFGYNSAGKYILRLKNTREGQKIKISVCEMLKANGEMQLSPYGPVCNSDDFYKPDGRAKAAVRNYDVYICRGGESESYMPRFAFNGFRYIKIEGADASQIADIKLAVMHNDVPFGWRIESSDPFFRSFAEITERSMQGNMINGFMDCPTREKNFWTGDIGMFATTACYLADVHSLLARWTDGGRKLGERQYGWGDEIYTIPLELYRFYGDKELLRARYRDILKFTYCRVGEVDGGLPSGAYSPYNDHLNPFGKNLSPDFFASCYYCYNLKCVSEIADILGDRVNAEKLLSYYEGAVLRFNDKYFLCEENDYTPHLQSGLILPLAFSLVPYEKRRAVAARLNEYIKEQGSLTTGYVATRFLMQVLCDYGYTDTAYMLLSREEFPSWRDLLKNATTVTEHWDGMAPSGCSKNHFALGSVVGWMFEYLGGIRCRESAPGFDTLCLKPVFIKEIGDFACEYTSRHGKIKTAWRYQGDRVIYEFSAAVPVRLVLPDGSETSYPVGSHKVVV